MSSMLRWYINLAPAFHKERNTIMLNVHMDVIHISTELFDCGKYFLDWRKFSISNPLHVSYNGK